jgi:hypothetical protein
MQKWNSTWTVGLGRAVSPAVSAVGWEGVALRVEAVPRVEAPLPLEVALQAAEVFPEMDPLQ